MTFTPAELDALQWLTDRTGDGSFAGHAGSLIACGDVGPHERKTWNTLIRKGALDTYGVKRVRVTATGRNALLDRRR